MLKGKQIAIISTNCLESIGLKSMLLEYFSPESVVIFTTLHDFDRQNSTFYDYVILNTAIFIAYHENFQTIKNKLILLIENITPAELYQTTYACIHTLQSQPEIVEQLEKIFMSRIKNQASDNQSELSAREIEVLKLVAEGLINKQIADQLFISLHTVITHRKNINRKLGIKTVSGLTVYALMNGLISSDQDRG